MKKTVVFLLFIFMLIFSSCTSDIKEQTEMIKYNEGTYYNKDWDEKIGSYEKDVIPNKETAIAVAVQIFNGMEKYGGAKDFTPQSVFYDESDGVWIVSFGLNNDEYGFDCCIAMQQNDGKVLRIWFGE